MRHGLDRRGGFTLIELVAVLVILAGIAAIVVPICDLLALSGMISPSG